MKVMSASESRAAQIFFKFHHHISYYFEETFASDFSQSFSMNSAAFDITPSGKTASSDLRGFTERFVTAAADKECVSVDQRDSITTFKGNPAAERGRAGKAVLNMISIIKVFPLEIYYSYIIAYHRGKCKRKLQNSTADFQKNHAGQRRRHGEWFILPQQRSRRGRPRRTDRSGMIRRAGRA